MKYVELFCMKLVAKTVCGTILGEIGRKKMYVVAKLWL